MPFSDPVLDGPVIQAAQAAALAAGFRTRDLFTIVEAIAASAAGVPVVMTYFNPVLAYGVDAFARDLAAAGGAGMITPDLIVDEAGRVAGGRRRATSSTPIFLVAPSSTAERIALTAAACRGFVYAASVMGVTGARDSVGARRRRLVGPLPRAHRPADRRRARGPDRGPGRRDRRVRRRGDRRIRLGVGRWTPDPPRCVPWPRSWRPASGAAAGRPRPAHNPRRDPLGIRRRGEGRADGADADGNPVAAARRLGHRSPSGPRLRGVHHHRHHRRHPVGQPTLHRPRRPARPDHRHLAVWMVPFGLVGGRLYHVITDPELYFGPGLQPVERVRDLERRARHLGRHRPRRARRVARLPATTRSRWPPWRTRWPRHRAWRRRSAGSATTSTRSCSARRRRCRGVWRSTSAPRAASPEPSPTASPPGRARSSRPPTSRPALRCCAGPSTRRSSTSCSGTSAWPPGGVGGPAVPAGSRPGVRALRRRVHRGPGVDRDAAHRPRQPHPRPADQRLRRDRGVPGRRGLPGADPPSRARGSGDRAGPGPRPARRPGDRVRGGCPGREGGVRRGG